MNIGEFSQDTSVQLAKLSRDAKLRFRWMQHFTKYRSARLTCRHFGISSDTFYHWKKRYLPNDLSSLEDNFRNRRPKSLRKPTWSPQLLGSIARLHRRKSALGRYRLAAKLKKQGHTVSASTIGRIIKSLEKSDSLA